MSNRVNKRRHYIACDLGAESGRVMLGTLAEDRVSLEEIHRFPTGATRMDSGIHWDVARIFDEIKTGLRKIAARKIPVTSISTDSWGVDYVLLQKDHQPLSPPYHYRDIRTDDGFDHVFAQVAAEEIFDETGIQFMTINTLYQLHHDRRERASLLQQCEKFLNIADYFNYLFSGVRKAEESLASTTQLYNPRARQWSDSLIEKAGLPRRIFPEIVPSATRLGAMSPALQQELGFGAEVVATCSHDTGAAIAATPGEGDSWAYLSSGTWSLLGIESPTPIITEKSRMRNFTNEAGYGGTTRFLKNIVGLWIIQECRRTWADEGKEYSYDELVKRAEEAPASPSLIHPNCPTFSKPDAMPEKIADYCRKTSQPIPQTPGQYVRCVLESLALLYRLTLEEIEDITGKKIGCLHIVGGGSKNRLLNQLSANAIQRPVIAGPVEATALGNVLLQAIAMGDLSSLDEVRGIVRNSFEVTPYSPQNQAHWQNAYEKLLKLPVNP